MSDRKPRAGNILLSNTTKPAVSDALKKMGYNISFGSRTSGPINAIYLDDKHKTIWGGSSNNGVDYGIGWQILSEKIKVKSEKWTVIV